MPDSDPDKFRHVTCVMEFPWSVCSLHWSWISCESFLCPSPLLFLADNIPSRVPLPPTWTHLSLALDAAFSKNAQYVMLHSECYDMTSSALLVIHSHWLPCASVLSAFSCGCFTGTTTNNQRYHHPCQPSVSPAQATGLALLHQTLLPKP